METLRMHVDDAQAVEPGWGDKTSDWVRDWSLAQVYARFGLGAELRQGGCRLMRCVNGSTTLGVVEAQIRCEHRGEKHGLRQCQQSEGRSSDGI
jgi:hypothetical protein